jgi:hypothetical protein
MMRGVARNAELTFVRIAVARGPSPFDELAFAELDEAMFRYARNEREKLLNVDVLARIVEGSMERTQVGFRPSPGRRRD